MVKRINVQTQNIVWLQNRPVAALDSNEQNAAPSIAWLHSDHLLTARAATDANQNFIWRWHSDAFGVGEAESLAQAGQPELTLNLRFPGQYHDQESGLYYNYFRNYDPNKGRYTQSDPIGLLGGINTFGYVAGNPLARLDPYGLLIVYPEDDPDFMHDVGLARQYLPIVDEYLRFLENEGSIILHIELASGSPQYDPGQQPECGEEPDPTVDGLPTLFWNPREGNLLPDGSIQSSALILLHELAHAKMHLTDPDMFWLGRDNQLEDDWTDAEEQRVILEIETAAARSVGEPVRTCHSCVKPVKVTNVDFSLNLQDDE